MSVKLEHLFCFVQGTYILAWSKEGGRVPRNSNDTIGVGSLEPAFEFVSLDVHNLVQVDGEEIQESIRT